MSSPGWILATKHSNWLFVHFGSVRLCAFLPPVPGCFLYSEDMTLSTAKMISTLSKMRLGIHETKQELTSQIMDSFFTSSQCGKKFDELRVLILVVDSSISDTSNSKPIPAIAHWNDVLFWINFLQPNTLSW